MVGEAACSAVEKLHRITRVNTASNRRWCSLRTDKDDMERLLLPLLLLRRGRRSTVPGFLLVMVRDAAMACVMELSCVCPVGWTVGGGGSGVLAAAAIAGSGHGPARDFNKGER